MELTSEEVLQLLMKWRTRVSAAAWTVVRDVHAAEDIFQNVALKAMTKDVRFKSEAALLSWAFVVARREGVDWLRRRQRETLGLDDELLGLLDQEWRSARSHPSGVKVEALRGCTEVVSDEVVPGSARRRCRVPSLASSRSISLSPRSGRPV